MAIVLALLGASLGLAGWIWIIVAAFQDGEVVWGVVSILCGLAALIYGIKNFDRLKIPTLMLVASIILNIGARFAGLGDAMGGG